jgi:hypothetical protein
LDRPMSALGLISGGIREFSKKTWSNFLLQWGLSGEFFGFSAIPLVKKCENSIVHFGSQFVTTIIDRIFNRQKDTEFEFRTIFRAKSE